MTQGFKRNENGRPTGSHFLVFRVIIRCISNEHNIGMLLYSCIVDDLRGAEYDISSVNLTFLPDFEWSEFYFQARLFRSYCGYTPMPGKDIFIPSNKSMSGCQRICKHGGGDLLLVADFVKVLKGCSPSISSTCLEKSLHGHLFGFAADQSRLEQRTVEK